MTRNTGTTFTNILSPSILAWRARYAAERAEAPAGSGPVTTRPRATFRKRVPGSQSTRAASPATR